MGKKSEGCLVTTSRKEMTRTLFTMKHLEPGRVKCGTLNKKNVRMCASGQMYCLHHRRVQGSCHCLDAKSQKKRQLQINNYGFSVVEVCNTKKNVKTTVT